MAVLTTVNIVGELLLIGMKAYNKYIETKDARRVREILKVQKDENSKPPMERDQSKLDNLEYELMLISKNFLSAIERARQDVIVPKPKK